MIDMPVPSHLKTPGVFSSTELAAWAQVGKNTVPQLVAHFGVRELTGNAKNYRFSVYDVLKRVLKVSPQTPKDLERLLIPLQKASWVSQMTGLSVSTISADACEKRGALPLPIELTVAGPNKAPARSRRWIPAQIEAHLRGDPIPFLLSSETAPKALSDRETNPTRNVFAEICGSNAEMSRQLQS